MERKVRSFCRETTRASSQPPTGLSDSVRLGLIASHVPQLSRRPNQPPGPTRQGCLNLQSGSSLPGPYDTSTKSSKKKCTSGFAAMDYHQTQVTPSPIDTLHPKTAIIMSHCGVLVPYIQYSKPALRSTPCQSGVNCLNNAAYPRWPAYSFRLAEPMALQYWLAFRITHSLRRGGSGIYRLTQKKKEKKKPSRASSSRVRQRQSRSQPFHPVRQAPR